MIEYLYFVKWLEDDKVAEEVFDFFNDAKSFAVSILSQQPEIHQTEIIRNDFGECIDSNELGKVWSWEELMNDIPEDSEANITNVFSKGDFAKYSDGYNPDNDHEFDDRDITFETDCVVSEHPLDEAIEPLATNKKGDYIIAANSGKGYTVFNKHDVVIGGFDGEDDDKAVKRFNVGDINESCRKPIPEGKSIKDLVEEMEENEDMVECKWCEELYEKDECRYEVNMGWLCPYCIEALKSRGEELTFREGYDLAEDVNNAFDPKEKVELYYDSLTALVYTKISNATYWDPAEYDEQEYTSDYSYYRTADDVATTIWENFITEEDAVDVEGGLETLEDDIAWKEFLNTHFDILLDKYYDQLLEY